MLTRLFQFKKYQTCLKTESAAGLSSFATASYLLLVVPLILSHAGIDFRYAYWSTALLMALSCWLMGSLANFPAIVGPGLGLLTYFSYVVTQQLHLSIAHSMAAIFCAGILMLLFTVSELRQRFIKAIPHSLGCAIASGIGFFIAFVALKNAGLIIANDNTFVQLANITTLNKSLFFIGFFLIAYLNHKGIKTAILIGILITTVLYYSMGLKPSHMTASSTTNAITPFLHLDFHHPTVQWISVAFTFFIIALFDSTGTLLGLCHQLDNQTAIKNKRLQRALLVESVCALIAPLGGITTPCPLVESATGITAGGRTGFTSIVAGTLFLLVMPLGTMAAYIPASATSAALFYTACLMLRPIAKIDWHQSKEYIPAVITLLMIPLSFSITNGVGLGVICYVVLNYFDQNWKKIDPLLWFFSVIFLLYFLH